MDSSNYQFTDLENQLFNAIKANNTGLVRNLIDAGVNVNCHDDCDSPLSVAYGNPEMVRLLLASGANPDMIVRCNRLTKSTLSDFAYLFAEYLNETRGDEPEPWLQCLEILKEYTDVSKHFKTYYHGMRNIMIIMSEKLDPEADNDAVQDVLKRVEYIMTA